MSTQHCFRTGESSVRWGSPDSGLSVAVRALRGASVKWAVRASRIAAVLVRTALRCFMFVKTTVVEMVVNDLFDRGGEPTSPSTAKLPTPARKPVTSRLSEHEHTARSTSDLALEFHQNHAPFLPRSCGQVCHLLTGFAWVEKLCTFWYRT